MIKNNMEEFKKIVAQNITLLRTQAGMTQAQLGEKLAYSDKSISKWERGAALPDAYVLKEMSRLFGVSVDYLLSEHTDDEKISFPPTEEKPKVNHGLITIVTVLGIITMVLLVFVILWLALDKPLASVFVYSIPAIMVAWLVFNSMWGNPRVNLIPVSGIVWGILASVYVTFWRHNWWQLFLVGIPAELVIVLSFMGFSKKK